jgi:thioredoxin-related protein
MKPFLILVQFCFCYVVGSPLASGQKTINWLTWEQVQAKSKIEKKKILVDIFTPWCGWCKKMDKTTFLDEEIVEYINKNYYAIKFDAESTTDIVLNDIKYQHVNNGAKGYHELAIELLQGRLSYPTTVFLDENFQVIQAIPGYQEAYTFGMIITYFASNSHKSIPWQRYSGQFVKAQRKKG